MPRRVPAHLARNMTADALTMANLSRGRDCKTIRTLFPMPFVIIQPVVRELAATVLEFAPDGRLSPSRHRAGPPQSASGQAIVHGLSTANPEFRSPAGRARQPFALTSPCSR